MWPLKMKRPGSRCRLFVLPVVCLIFFGAACAQFEPISEVRPLVVKPERPQTQQISQQDLAPLIPSVRSKLLENIRGWKLYIRKFENTIDLYNQEAKRHNEEVRRRLQE